MVTFIKSCTFDCADGLALGTFWAAALGSDLDEDSTRDKAFVEPAGAGRADAVVPAGAGGARPPRTASTSTCGPPTGTWRGRCAAPGASAPACSTTSGDRVVMADPEGNEFCVE